MDQTLHGDKTYQRDSPLACAPVIADNRSLVITARKPWIDENIFEEALTIYRIENPQNQKIGEKAAKCRQIQNFGLVLG